VVLFERHRTDDGPHGTAAHAQRGAEAEEALDKFKRALDRLDVSEVTQPAAG